MTEQIKARDWQTIRIPDGPGRWYEWTITPSMTNPGRKLGSTSREIDQPQKSDA